MILLKFFPLYTAGLELMCLNPGIPFPHRLTLFLKETLFFILLLLLKIRFEQGLLCCAGSVRMWWSVLSSTSCWPSPPEPGSVDK